MDILNSDTATSIVSAVGVTTAIVKNRELLKMLYGDSVQPGIIKVGKALEIVLELFISPISYWSEKTKLYFANSLKLYEEKLQNIPDENIIEVNPEIGIPILEKLTYIRSEELRELYVNLLASASNRETIDRVHPKFVQIISSLTVEETLILKYLVENKCFIPFIEYHAIMKDGHSRRRIAWNLTGLEYKLEFALKNNIDIYIENLINNGLLFSINEYIIDYDYNIIEEQYKEIKENFLNENVEFLKIKTEKKYYTLTDIGHMFIKSVT